MKTSKTICIFFIYFAAVALIQADQIYEKCEVPKSPSIPVGNVSEEQLNSAVSTFKNFQSDLENFRNCLDQLKLAIDEDAMDEKTVEKNRKFNLKLDSIYNASVDREQAVADRLNTQIRLFKSNQEFKNKESSAN